MDRWTQRTYKRICFHGRGAVARWLDRAFFALLGSICLYLACRNLLLSLVLLPASFAASVLWAHRRWDRFRHELWQRTVTALKRENWVKTEAGALRQTGGVILYPTPQAGDLVSHCLRFGKGTAFHCFGEAGRDLIMEAKSFGCTLTCHPWQEGVEPSREQVVERLRRDAPKRERNMWRRLLQLPSNRYLLTGGVLLFLSLVLRRALYWRLLGSLCLTLGALRRLLHVDRI